MRLNDITNLAQDPNLIPGIHNYCDRWCERCPYTARCLLFATEEADSDNDPASRDISNAAFWERLTTILQDTREMISGWAQENGVDLSPEVLTAVQAQNDDERAEARNHPLAVAAEQYAWDVDNWFKQCAQPLEVFNDGGPESGEALDENDYTEVIRWYQFQIAVKIIRGIHSRADEEEYLDQEEPRDSDGSVKVALIGIDRSFNAWRLMRELRVDSADRIQTILLSLEQLRLLTEKEFPVARDFIRPGFDENLDKLQ